MTKCGKQNYQSGRREGSALPSGKLHGPRSRSCAVSCNPKGMTRPDYWLTKLSKLRLDRARGDPAPHKPLLLLVLCDLVEKGEVHADVLPLSPELTFRFHRVLEHCPIG